MNKIFIDKIAPGHDKRDCSDNNLINHTHTPYDQGCRRCDLLKACDANPKEINIKLNTLFPVPPEPPKSKAFCEICGNITKSDKHTNWLCKLFK